MRHGFRGVFFFCILCRISALYGRCLLLSDERHLLHANPAEAGAASAFFYFRSRSRAVAGPVSASLRTESRRLLRGFFILRPDRIGSPPRRRRGGRSPHLRAPRPESGRRAGFPSPTLLVDQIFVALAACEPLFSVEMTVRSFGNSTMSMFLPFWFFAFRRKNDTVVAELCERKVGSAVASGICRNVPRLRPENSARRTVPGARGVNH